MGENIAGGLGFDSFFSLVAEPPPLEFHHMFGNKEVGVQVLENVCGQLAEGYGDEVEALGRNILQISKACIICWLYTSVFKS